MNQEPHPPRIDRILDLMKNEESCLKLDEPMEKAFPRLGQAIARVGSQFAAPMDVMKSTVVWIWLSVHAGLSEDRVRTVVRSTVERSLLASNQAGGDYSRPDHDVFLMMASILAGDSALRQKTAATVLPANPASGKFQFLEAWTGILRARVLGKPDQEAEQLEVLLRKRGFSTYLCPSHATAKAFCHGDYRALNKCLRKTFAKERELLVKEERIIKTDSGDEIVSVRGRDVNFFWPWAEAAFAKLVSLEGAEVERDELWLPSRLLVL